MVSIVCGVFEGIAKTNTTHTFLEFGQRLHLFEGIAKTNTTHTLIASK